MKLSTHQRKAFAEVYKRNREYKTKGAPPKLTVQNFKDEKK